MGFLSRYCAMVLQSGCTSAQFWQLCMGILTVPYSWEWQCWSSSNPPGCACCSVVHFLCVVLLPVEDKVLFTYLLTTRIYFLAICLFKIPHWVFCLFLTDLQDSQYMVDVRPLSEKNILQIFLPWLWLVFSPSYSVFFVSCLRNIFYPKAMKILSQFSSKSCIVFKITFRNCVCLFLLVLA